MNEYDVFDRHAVTFHVLINVHSPLSHIGETTGNVSNLKTLKLLDLEGFPRQCFVYSGNALRNGVLRRKGIAMAMERLGIKVNPDTHHTLFAGGRIDGSTDSDMELDRKIRQLLPCLSVLGTAKPVGVFGHKKAQMVAGRINVGSAYLICYESLRYIYQQCPGFLNDVAPIENVLKTEYTDPFKPQTKSDYRQKILAETLPLLRKQYPSWTQYITTDQTTRRDSLHDSGLRTYLADVPVLVGTTEEKERKSDQMIANDRLIMGGTKLYSRWDFYGTDIEEGFIYDALMAFSKTPYLGGKGNRGNGLVSMEFWCDAEEKKTHLLSIGQSQQILTERAENRLRDYHEYLDQYREFLADAKSSKEIKQLLGV